ncbi:metal-dependent hydrolase family protein [Pseudomonas chlororaphis]|nr:amidohydrolase family protein [Pseudomonas chlororaphis]
MDQSRVGSVQLQGAVIADVHFDVSRPPSSARIIDISGCTLIPGLIDGHAHLSFLEKADISKVGDIPPEEHVLLTMHNARRVLHSGFTSVLSGGSAKTRLDVVIRNEILAGRIPGPRMLAASPELTSTGNLGDERRLHIHKESVALIVDGADEMLRTSRMLMREGVDILKLNISGNQTVPSSRPHQTIMTDEEVAVAVRTAHAHGKRVAAHVRAAESVKMALRHGVDILYHCEYADEECLDLMEAARDRIYVAPAVGLLYATIHEAERWGITRQKAAELGLEQQLESLQTVTPQLRQRGVRLLIGGDYGFPWTPHGTNARDLQHFVKLFGFSPVEALAAGTAIGASAMQLADSIGRIATGYTADLLVVRGDPTIDPACLVDPTGIRLVIQGGRIVYNRMDLSRSRYEFYP